jgi:hypothetical protein
VEYQYSFTEFFEVTCLNLTLSLSEWQNLSEYQL